MATNTVTDETSKREIVYGAFGVSFAWAWLFRYFFFQPFSESFAIDEQVNTFRVLLMGGLTVAALLLLFFYKKEFLFHNRSLTIIGCSLCSLCSFTSALSQIGFANEITLCINIFLGGIGYGFLGLVWEKYFGGAGATRSGFYIAGSILIGGLLYLCILGVASISSVAADIITALMVWLFLLVVFKSEDSGQERPHRKTKALSPRVSPSFIVYAVLYGLIYGFILGLSAHGAAITPSNISAINLSSILGVIVAGGVLFFWSLNQEPKYSAALRMSLLFVATGFIVLAVMGVEKPYVAIFFTIFGYIVFWILYKIIWAEVSSQLSMSTFIIGAQGVAISSLAIGCGVAFCQWGVGRYFDNAYVLSLISLGVVFLLLLVNLFFVGDRALAVFLNKPKETEAPLELEDRVEKIAQEYKLTPRESEIALMLARGRNPKRIQEELVVSVNTVRTHVRSIYEKLDIHSHQELIDLVEKEEDPAAPESRK